MPGNFEIKASKLKVVKGNFLQNQERSAILPLYCLWPLTIKCTFIRLYFLHDIVVIVRRLKESFFRVTQWEKKMTLHFFPLHKSDLLLLNQKSILSSIHYAPEIFKRWREGVFSSKWHFWWPNLFFLWNWFWKR